MVPSRGPWGRKGEQEIDSSAGAVGGRGLATTGKILGMVATTFLVLGGIAIVVAVIIQAPALS